MMFYQAFLLFSLQFRIINCIFMQLRLTEIDQNGHQFDLDDEDSFRECCFLYGYIDP